MPPLPRAPDPMAEVGEGEGEIEIVFSLRPVRDGDPVSPSLAFAGEAKKRKREAESQQQQQQQQTKEAMETREDDYDVVGSLLGLSNPSATETSSSKSSSSSR